MYMYMYIYIYVFGGRRGHLGEVSWNVVLCVVFCHLVSWCFWGFTCFFNGGFGKGWRVIRVFFSDSLRGDFEKLLEIMGKIRCLRRIDHCHSRDRKRKVPKYPFLLRTCLFLTSEQVKIVFLGHLGLTADSKPEKWHWSHLLDIFCWMNTPPEITCLGTLIVDFEILSLQPKKCWCIQNLTGWKDT